ncbi:MAG: SpoIIIAC/SpoIIIAD family protein [Oscillospiraceae bacterium]
MEIIKVVGIGLIGATMALLLGEYKKELSLMVTIATGIVIMLIMLQSIEPVLEVTTSMFSKANMDKDYIRVLLKALGICFLTQIAVDACKDSGNSAIASKIEMAGKIAVLFVALPLFLSLLELVGTLIWI